MDNRINLLPRFSDTRMKLEANYAKILKYVAITAFILILFSFTSEFEFRGNWLIWTETMIVLMVFIVFLLKIAPALYVSVSNDERNLYVKNLPHISKRFNLILICLLVGMILLLDLMIA